MKFAEAVRVELAGFESLIELVRAFKSALQPRDFAGETGTDCLEPSARLCDAPDFDGFKKYVFAGFGFELEGIVFLDCAGVADHLGFDLFPHLEGDILLGGENITVAEFF